MAGTIGAGFVHFNKVSGINGVYKGAAGSEIQLDDPHSLVTVSLAGSSTAIEAAYVVVPYAATIKYAYADICGGTTGTGAAVTLYLNDTAGTSLATASFASAGTAGQALLTLTTSSTVAIAALSSIAIVKASCATAYGATITIGLTKTA